MSAASVFVATSRFKNAISLFNNVDTGKLEKIASTIITRLNTTKDEASFNEAESEQLRALLSVSVEELDIIVSGISYIWDQAAFYNLTADKLVAQLIEHNMSEAAVNVFGSIWAANKQKLISSLRDRTFGAPMVLSDIDWRLQLTMSHQNISKTKVLNSILSLEFTDANDQQNIDSLLLEFSKEELFALYSQLETVQSQLDHISK